MTAVGMVDVVLIMRMRVEATHIAARAILQGAAPLRMPLGSGRWTDEAEGGHAGERATGGDEEVTARSVEGSCLFSASSHHPSPFVCYPLQL